MSETNLFKVLADKQRRDILVLLREKALSAGEIAQRLSVTPAALSYHLRLLKQAGLVSEYKAKNFIYYELNTTVLDELVIWVSRFGGNGNEKADMDSRSTADADNGGSDTVYAR